MNITGRLSLNEFFERRQMALRDIQGAGRFPLPAPPTLLYGKQ